MAEIKSTMEMVLERAARMEKEAPAVTNNDDTIKKGMRLAADYLNGKITDLQETLSSQSPEEQADIRKGMAQTLLRNIVLPRDEILRTSAEKALMAIQLLAGAGSETDTVCQELAQLLNQYSQHKEQTTAQLEDAIKAQLQQQAMAAGRQPADDINPAMHPHYAEELAKTLTTLNNQYNEAMNQRKDIIMQRFTIG